jgi:hypothetical protein
MSKHQIDITKKVMSKIKTEQIKMKPKWYFWLGSISMFIALVGLVIVSIFLISLVTFSLKTHGPMGAIRYQQIISGFPWWAPIIVVIGLVTGIFLLKKYDISYKKNFLFIVLMFIVAILFGGILVDILGFDTLWMKRGPMRRFYQQYDGNHQQKWNNNIKKNGWGRENFQ